MSNYILAHGDTLGFAFAIGYFVCCCCLVGWRTVAEERVKYPALPWRWRGRR